ncbi:N-acetylglucosaminyl transferase component-domain-containing protein [Irpex rosettiformis]|uniref:N-acetylglucosaminyl transferase component-domain-containing protein n=1 Tax=Irpex rosettiformis TaxID=378272 RepID=A0ACB8TXF7_9APHY|nr:N-acetylglucosaminyl transferase component-domain-containing protein [Irpex rosettiformis]
MRPSLPDCGPLSSRTLRVVNQMNFGFKAITQTVPELHLSRKTRAHDFVQGPEVFSDNLRWMSRPSTPPETFVLRGSALALQVNIRFGHLQYLWSKFPPPSYRRNSISTDIISSYIGFYNCLWLIANDIIIGIAIGSLFHGNADLLSCFLKGCIQDIQRTLLWLNNWPAGLKLNTELSNLYCHLLLSVMIIWNPFMLPCIGSLVYVSGTIGYCGVTMTIALLTDILSLFIAHMHLCYVLSLTVFSKQLDAASALWKLFRGKKRNTLRRRTDSWLFDVDQLLFGTILFTLLAFISPTIITYYALFALLHLCALVVYDFLDILLMLINQFPLFMLMLHLKDPFRLPVAARVIGFSARLLHCQSSLATIVCESMALCIHNPNNC